MKEIYLMASFFVLSLAFGGIARAQDVAPEQTAARISAASATTETVQGVAEAKLQEE